MIQFLPYALAAYGGYKGYKGAKDSGASGIQRLLAGATGAYTGYNLGNMVPGTTCPPEPPVLIKIFLFILINFSLC